MQTDEILGRIFDKLDAFDDKLDKTCSTISTIEKNFALLERTVCDHLNEIEKTKEHREKKFYVIMALMGTGFTVFEIAKSMI